MDYPAIFVCLMAVFPMINCQDRSGFTILPEKTKLLVLQGDRLELTCIYEHSGPSVELTFYKNQIMIDGSNLNGYNLTKMSHSLEPQPAVRDTKTLTKNQTVLSDAGEYECRVSPDKSTSIKVDIFTVAVTNGELPVVKDKEPVPPVVIGCMAENVDVDVDKNITWQHAGKQLEDGDKYSISDNGTLVINSPKRADMGEYQCTFVFFPTSAVEKHTVNPQPAVVKAGPAIVYSDNSKNMVQGDDLELKCEVSGYPMPKVTWLKDGVEMNSTTRIHFLEYKGAQGKLKIFSLEDGDEGYYKCFASNEINPYNATAEMRLRVKDKLAALWPFLGIVAEVVVLCVIILVYEKRRSKKLAEEEDVVDANQENTPDHKDVRHRRT